MRWKTFPPLPILPPERAAYIAGVVDSDGCIRIRPGRDSAVVDFATKDNFIVPTIASWLGLQFRTAKNGLRVLGLQGAPATDLLRQITPFLFTKQNRAKLVLSADDGEVPYDVARAKLAVMNGQGIAMVEDTEPREHQWHWAWLAGLTDGDGAFCAGTWTVGKRKIQKPYYQIMTTHRLTMERVAKAFATSCRVVKPGRGAVKNASVKYSVRAMPTALLETVPLFQPYLVYKASRAELAVKCAKLKRDVPNGSFNDPRLEEANALWQLLREENTHAYDHVRKTG